MLLLLFLSAIAAGVAGAMGADPAWMVGTQAAVAGAGWLLLLVCDMARGRPTPARLLRRLVRAVRRGPSGAAARWLLAVALRRPSVRPAGTGPAWGRPAQHRRGQ